MTGRLEGKVAIVSGARLMWMILESTMFIQITGGGQGFGAGIVDSAFSIGASDV